MRTLAAWIIPVAMMVSVDALSQTKQHAGDHPDLYAKNCVDPLYPEDGEILGHWKNSCPIGVNVAWHLENEYGMCKSQPGFRYPCGAYVPPNATVKATVKGDVAWGACKVESRHGGPFPKAYGLGYGCYHLAYRHGESRAGVYRSGKGFYVGALDDRGRRHGLGEYYWNDGGFYKGEFLRGRLHGHGTYVFPNGNVYTGQWEDGKRTGKTFVALVEERRLAKLRRETEELRRETEEIRRETEELRRETEEIRREAAEARRRRAAVDAERERHGQAALQEERERRWREQLEEEREEREWRATRERHRSSSFMGDLTRGLMDRSTDNLLRALQNQGAPSTGTYSDCLNDPNRTTTCSP